MSKELPPVRARGRIIRIEEDKPRNLSKAPTNRNNSDFLETGSAGASTILLPGGPTAPWKSFIDVNTDDKKSIPITVSLSNYLMGNSSIAIGATRGSLDAKITWGAGGGSAEAFIDFMNGCVFTIVCSSFSLDIRNTYPDPGFNQNIFQLSAFLSKGPKGSGNSPQRTIQIFGLVSGTQNLSAGETSAAFIIPRFGKTAMFTRGVSGSIGTTTVAGAYIEFRDGNGNPVQSFYLGDNELCPQIPIPNGAIDGRIKNISAVTANTCQMVYDLAI